MTPREAPPEFYDRHYFLDRCGGYAEFCASDGQALDAVRRTALALADPRPGERVLDLGCGRGELLRAAAQRSGRGVGVDFSDAALGLARQTVAPLVQSGTAAALAKMDARELGFRPERFDVIFMLDVVEHLDPANLSRVMDQVRSLLRAGGRVIVHTGPTVNFVRFGQYVKRALYWVQGRPLPPRITFATEAVQAGHCNLQSKRSLERALAGFTQSRVWYQFSESDRLRDTLSRLGASRLLAFNLWAWGQR